ncbi:hypothetical protein ACSVMW_000425 [Vibrio parahaemolyticus]
MKQGEEKRREEKRREEKRREEAIYGYYKREKPVIRDWLSK